MAHSHTHQWITRFPPEFPSQKLNHGLKVIRNCHSKEVLLHYRRVPNGFEADDDYRITKTDADRHDTTCVHVHGSVSQFRDGRPMQCHVCDPNLLWGLSSCRILEQRDPLQGPHQLQDLGRTMREISGWRLVSTPCRSHCRGAAYKYKRASGARGICRPANFN